MISENVTNRQNKTGSPSRDRRLAPSSIRSSCPTRTRRSILRIGPSPSRGWTPSSWNIPASCRI
jgi:hypothetical protein